MRNDIKLLCLVPVYGALGAAATWGLWLIFDRWVEAAIPPPYAVLACVLWGLPGPVTVGAVAWIATRRTPSARWPAIIGLGMVLATELAFYVPIGFLAVAFHTASL